MMKAGDILMVHNHGFIFNVIRFITRSHWNHCGVFVNDREIVEAAFIGVIKSPIEKFRDLQNSGDGEYAIYRMRGISDDDVKKVVAFNEKQVGQKYDKFQIGRIFLMYVLRLPKTWAFPDGGKKWICSELVAESFALVGWLFSMTIIPDNIVPGDIVRSAAVVKVEPGEII
jgi:uncharacterized protein YycO